jgi:hypothetical protein
MQQLVTDRKHTGTMNIMDSTGHSKQIWDKDVPEEVAAAKAAFDALKAKGYSAFYVQNDGKDGKRMDEFDKNAESLIMVPPKKGG